MRRVENLPLVVGLGVSVLLHVVVIVWVFALQNAAAGGVLNAVKMPELDAVMPEVKHPPVGKDEPSVARLSWIAAEDFQALIANRQAKTDQPVFQQMADAVENAPLEKDATPPTPSPAPLNAPPVKPRLVEELVREESAPPDAGVAEDATVTRQSPLALQDRGGELMAAGAVAAEMVDGRELEEPEDRVEAGRAAVARTEREEKPEEERVAEAVAARPPTPRVVERVPALASPLSRPTSATRSDRESDPFGRKTAVVVRPGSTLVGEGVEIKTVAPRFGVVARALTVPANPTARLRFAADGRVIFAELDASTGYGNIDGPLLNSLYKWRAEGARLERETRGERTFDLEVKIELR